MGALESIQNALGEAQTKRTQQPDCGYSGTLPQIYFQTITKVALGGAKPDVYVKFPQPIDTIWIASKDAVHATDSLYFHFLPLGKSYSGNSITPDGSENWFDMTITTDSGTARKGKFIRFRTPFIDGYFDIGQEAGGSDYYITIAGTRGEIIEMRNNIGAIGT